MATKAEFNEKFIIEVPKQDGTFDEIKGIVLKLSPKMKKSVNETFKERDDIAKANKKKQNKISRLQQKAQNLELRIPITKDDDKKNQLLEEQQSIMNEAYKLSDELEESIPAEEEDIVELISKLHIDKRVRLDEENKKKIDIVCDIHGYSIVWETILEDIKKGKSQDTKS